jgi:hypothetical protein
MYYKLKITFRRPREGRVQEIANGAITGSHN